MASEVIERRLKEHQNLGGDLERQRLGRGGELAELGDGSGAAGGDGGERCVRLVQDGALPHSRRPMRAGAYDPECVDAAGIAL